MRERKREIEIEEKCRTRNSCICECFVLLFVSRESEIDSEEWFGWKADDTMAISESMDDSINNLIYRVWTKMKMNGVRIGNLGNLLMRLGWRWRWWTGLRFFFSEFVGFNFNFWMKVQGERKIIMMCKKFGCVIFFLNFWWCVIFLGFRI